MKILRTCGCQGGRGGGRGGGGGGVTQWHGEISFSVSGRQASHLQSNIQPGKLIWTHEASWVAYVTEPEWAGRVHDYNIQRECFHGYWWTVVKTKNINEDLVLFIYFFPAWDLWQLLFKIWSFAIRYHYQKQPNHLKSYFTKTFITKSNSFDLIAQSPLAVWSVLEYIWYKCSVILRESTGEHPVRDSEVNKCAIFIRVCLHLFAFLYICFFFQPVKNRALFWNTTEMCVCCDFH